MRRALRFAVAGLAAAALSAPSPARNAADVPKAPLRVEDRALAAWIEGWFPWTPGEIGIEKAKTVVPGWSAWTATKKFRDAPGEDRTDVFVSADGRNAIVGSAFFDEERAAAPAPINGPGDISVLRDFVTNHIFGTTMRPRVRLEPTRDLPGMRGVAIGIETGYGKYELPAFVTEKDGALFVLGSSWKRDRGVPEQRRDRIDLSATPAEGPESAKVTLVEYSDMQCPMCKKRSAELSELLDRMKGELPVRRYVKTYPLTQVHPWAFRAASVARALFRKNPSLFFSFKSNVFARQEQLDVPSFDAFAADFAIANGLPSPVPACYADDENNAPIFRDLSEGFTVGVRSTPTYFVNGVMLVWMDDQIFEEYLRKTFLGGKGLPLPKPSPTAAPKATAPVKH